MLAVTKYDVSDIVTWLRFVYKFLIYSNKALPEINNILESFDEYSVKVR